MELEVGMYVRTKYGYIAKITEADDRHIYCDNAITKSWGEEFNILFSDDFEEMVKASHNIIDLIEVGDYVNGYKISAIYDDDSLVNEYNLKHKKCLGKNIYDEDYQEYLIYEEEIETIVTKEQFEAMAYKVG